MRACPSPAWVDALPLADDEVGLAVRAYVEADRAFVDAVTAGRAPEPGLDVALEAHRLVDAAYRSAADGGSADRLRRSRPRLKDEFGAAASSEVAVAASEYRPDQGECVSRRPSAGGWTAWIP